MKSSRAFWSSLAMTLAATSAAAVPVPVAAAGVPAARAASGAGAFDFLHGNWSVRNRRLADRLAGSDEWIEFDAITEVAPLPGGLGQIDIYRTDFWPDFVGITLRIYNPRSRQWSLVWIDNHNLPGVVQPAVVGAFEGDTGVFTGADRHRGRPIVVRYIWQVRGRNAARWEQAFSVDDGATWETNWIMDFTRTDE